MRVCVRQPLTANRTYYVRTDGSDSNTGLENTAGGAFRTIQKASNVVSNELDLAGYTCVIQVGAGTYAEAVFLKPYVGSNKPILRGDNATPANVVVSPASGNAVTVEGSLWQVEGLKVQSTDHGLVAMYEGATIFQNMDFGACGYSHVTAMLGGSILVAGNYQISGGGLIHFLADSSGSSIRVQQRTITLSGTPNFSQGFAYATRAGSILANANTFVGSATGLRYQARGVGVIETSGGANYFPGNAAGAVADGGVYI